MAYSILIVDDENEILSALNRLFYDREDITVHLAKSGKEGLKILENHPVDIVISDQIMPGMSGAEFLNEVNRLYPETIRMLLTGYSNMEAAIDAINKGGISRYLSKPWNDEEIILIVDQAIELIRLKKENQAQAHIIQEKNQELHARMQWFDNVLRSMGEGVIVTDLSGRITYINSVAEVYTGFNVNDALSKELAEIFYVLDDKKHFLIASLMAKLKEDGFCMISYQDMQMVNRNGIEIKIDFKISPILDEGNDSKQTGLVLVFHEKK